jgi:CBS domain-containing protein
MKVSDVMTREVKLANPNDTLRDICRTMAQIDTGAMPVGDGERLVGMITDRDVAIRGVAEGKGPDAKVSEVMSKEVLYCFDDEDLDHVARNMGDVKVRRLPVVNRDKRLVGIVSLGDVAISGDTSTTDTAVVGVSEPGGQH